MFEAPEAVALWMNTRSVAAMNSRAIVSTLWQQIDGPLNAHGRTYAQAMDSEPEQPYTTFDKQKLRLEAWETSTRNVDCGRFFNKEDAWENDATAIIG